MADMVEVDARGLSCPQPVIETKKAIEKTNSGEIHVLVDTMTSVMNVAGSPKTKAGRSITRNCPKADLRSY